MPPGDKQKNALRVLLTGFGPFSTFKENPSWLAVRALHNAVLPGQSSKQIHITSYMVPVSYDTVLAAVPGLHARPPILPSDHNRDTLPPPPHGYDLIIHVGAGDPGAVTLERCAHKTGYRLPDANGKFAPIVETSPAPGPNPVDISAAERREIQRLRSDDGTAASAAVVRGFGPGFEEFDDVLETSLDIDGLVTSLEKTFSIKTSDDAGHYICELIYYASLAEAQRTQQTAWEGKTTKVLFMHCPPTEKLAVVEEVSRTIKAVVIGILSLPT
ncbi:peptidase C15, pyroglutamyl peptidase I-like protein [Athelia psychrophila]|uniref:Peptidase C15, pyroglutamyl peptidase I-like protein n=1 Tax=Athelia psychrophila TaxID=1759441 RepID=A0A166F328_9AGAM|nr:peptidase C15, pyroglutamyl peptidase I-like protein [Fibularhizoctonia sp. CBS 109695]